MPEAACSIEQIAPDDGPSLARIAELYVEAFPANERKPVSFLWEAARRSDYILLGLRCGEALLGFALLYESPTSGFRLLEYMAVDHNMRDRGLGSMVFRTVANRDDGRTLLLEVERETEGPTADITRRRRTFYQRHGCREIAGLDYVMPRVTSVPPPPMSLFFCSESDGTVSRPTLRCWIEEIYDKVYAVKLSDDRLNAMLTAEEGSNE